MKFFNSNIINLLIAILHLIDFEIFIQLVEFYDGSTEYFFSFTL